LRLLPSLAAGFAALVLMAGAAAGRAGELVPASRAGELVMVETKGCAWCAKWHREIGPIYPKTAEGQRLPLRVVRMENMPADLRFLKQLRYAPTFVAVSCGREMGRVVGYGGDDLFWGELSQIYRKLPATC